MPRAVGLAKLPLALESCRAKSEPAGQDVLKLTVTVLPKHTGTPLTVGVEVKLGAMTVKPSVVLLRAGLVLVTLILYPVPATVPAGMVNVVLPGLMVPRKV